MRPGWIGSIIGLLFSLISVPGNIGRFGLHKYKNWARYLVLLLTEFDLFMVPLGTVFAI